MSLNCNGGRRGRGSMAVDLQLPVQSVSITTNVESSNRSVVFFGYSGFFH